MALSYESRSDYWYSKNVTNSWIQFDFREWQISMREYTLKAHGDCNRECHFRQWKIEGSNDLSKWEMLDERAINEMTKGWAAKTLK
jgi:hypothetical protein